MEEKLIQIKNHVHNLIRETDNLSEINKIKLEIFGKSGSLTILLKDIAKLPEEERPHIGRLANEIKDTIETLFSDRMQELSHNSIHSNRNSRVDITQPGIKPPLGHLHLLTQGIEEITEIFSHIGFSRVRYPEVEWDWFAFTALNFSQNHPARDDWETFFVKAAADKKYGPMILTPHTSSGQIREMLRLKKPPIRMLNIAKCYRRQSDVSHTPMFHQFETLCIGENISITHLKGMLDYFVKSYFGENRRARIRPYHFQFTEPSFETDVSCGVCNGTGMLEIGEKCRLCKGGWLEMGGAGMVHPNVLKNCGIDPHKYTGFASGWGVERVIMMKEGLELDDLRLLYSNNLDFLEQF